MIVLQEALYCGDFLIKLTFNTGESSVVDFLPVIKKYTDAAPLLNTEEFRKFSIDAWPTLVWECGFDVSPEYLYELATGKAPSWHQVCKVANS